MTIEECLNKYYGMLCSNCRNIEQVIYDSKTCEDILNDCCIHAFKKFENVDIDEEQLYQEVKKMFLMEMKFSWKRRASEKIIFLENLNNFNDRTE